jgi:hypothetical protein
MAAARIADEPAPPETLDVVRRQRQLLHRARVAALCLDPIAEEKQDDVPLSSSSPSPKILPSCFCNEGKHFVIRLV